MDSPKEILFETIQRIGMKREKILILFTALLLVSEVIFFIFFDIQHWFMAAFFVLWIIALIVVGVEVLGEDARQSFQITPIYDLTLKKLGFRYNVEYERWQIGKIGTLCYIYYDPATGLMECFNFTSGNEEHFERLVHSIEEIQMVLDACGVTEDIIEKSQLT